MLSLFALIDGSTAFSTFTTRVVAMTLEQERQ